MERCVLRTVYNSVLGVMILLVFDAVKYHWPLGPILSHLKTNFVFMPDWLFFANSVQCFRQRLKQCQFVRVNRRPHYDIRRALEK